MGRLKDKIVIVTGAGQGMGEATALMIAGEGAHVVITDINQTSGRAVAERIGAGATFVPLDVASGAQWQAVVDGIMASHGRIDGLVNNAGIHFNALIEDTREEALRSLLDINLIGPWLGMKAVIPHMKAARRGAIVNISSVEGLTGYSGSTAYAAAKWGMRGMTKSVAMEVGPFGVRVNAIMPGAIDTPMLSAGLAGTEFGALFPGVAMNRAGRPEEVAAATLFLLSDESTYVSGTDLTVDGAWTCGEYLLNKPVADHVAA